MEIPLLLSVDAIMILHDWRISLLMSGRHGCWEVTHVTYFALVTAGENVSTAMCYSIE